MTSFWRNDDVIITTCVHWNSQRGHGWSLTSTGKVTNRYLLQANLDTSFLIPYPLHWRHNDHDSVSNHQPHGCLLNLLFRRRSKKTSKLRVTGLYVGNSPGPVNSPHKGPVTRKMFPFDDVIMLRRISIVFKMANSILPGFCLFVCFLFFSIGINNRHTGLLDGTYRPNYYQ